MSVLKEYIKKLKSKKLINTKRLKEFVKKYGIGKYKPSQLTEALASLPAEAVEKYYDEIQALQNIIGLNEIEKKYGSTVAYSFIRATSPAYLKDLKDYYQEIINDPNFSKYYQQEKQHILDTYELNKRELEKQKELQLKDLALQEDYQKKIRENYQNEINKYTNYAKEDYITKLKGTNQQLDQAMQQATEVYGMKNLINSGYFKQIANQAMQQGQNQINQLQTNLNRTIQDYQDKLKQARDKFNNAIQQINLNKEKINQLTGLDLEKLNKSQQWQLSNIEKEKFLTGTQIASQRYADEIARKQQQAIDIMNNILKKQSYF